MTKGGWCGDEFGAYMAPLYHRPFPDQTKEIVELRAAIAELATVVKQLSDEVHAKRR